MRKNIIIKYLIYTTIFCCFATVAKAGWDLERQIDLRGQWLIEIGDSQEFADPDYDDSGWESISVPGSWENAGFPGVELTKNYLYKKVEFIEFYSVTLKGTKPEEVSCGCCA